MLPGRLPSRVSGGLGQVRGPQSKMENARSGEFVTYVGYAPVRLIWTHGCLTAEDASDRLLVLVLVQMVEELMSLTNGRDDECVSKLTDAIESAKGHKAQLEAPEPEQRRGSNSLTRGPATRTTQTRSRTRPLGFAPSRPQTSRRRPRLLSKKSPGRRPMNGRTMTEAAMDETALEQAAIAEKKRQTDLAWKAAEAAEAEAEAVAARIAAEKLKVQEDVPLARAPGPGAGPLPPPPPPPPPMPVNFKKKPSGPPPPPPPPPDGFKPKPKTLEEVGGVAAAQLTTSWQQSEVAAA